MISGLAQTAEKDALSPFRWGSAIAEALTELRKFAKNAPSQFC
jgi:hypothetical protein